VGAKFKDFGWDYCKYFFGLYKNQFSTRTGHTGSITGYPKVGYAEAKYP
jgi:hypothetical protein